MKVITRGEATRLINKEDAVVVDLRQRDDYVKAISQVLSTCCQAKSKPTMLVSLRSTKTNRLSSWMIGSGMQCQNANALTKAGFAQVFVLKEGVAGWAGENLPLVRGK
ncbi:rhodanese-like domain-containing protein [Escherichia coli]